MKNKKVLSIVADLSLIAIAIIWGSGFVGVQYAINSNMSASLILAMRFCIAALVLLFIFFKEIIKATKKEWKSGIIAGTFLFGGFLLQTIGQAHTSISKNAFITSVNVIIVPFLTWLFIKKRPGIKSFALSFSCLIGVGILNYSPELGFTFNIGDFLTFLCAIMFAAHIAYLDMVSKDLNVKSLVFIQMFTAAVLSVITLFTLDYGSIFKANYSTGLLPVIYLGLFSTCLCFFLQTFAQKYTTSSAKAAIFLSAESLFGTVFSLILGLDNPSWSIFLGGSIIFLSAVLIEIKFDAFKRKIPDKSRSAA